MFGLDFGSSDAETRQNVWDPQSNFLQNIYSGSNEYMDNGANPYLNMAMQSGENAIGDISGYSDQAGGAWNNFLQGGTFGGQQWDPSGVQNMAQGQGAGFDTLNAMQNPVGNPYLNTMAQSGIGRMLEGFNQNTMPGITNNADMSGGLGGSRQGIAEGNAAGNLFNAGSDFLSNLYGGQYQSDMNRAMTSAGMSLGAQNQGYNTMQQFGQGADQTGINALAQSGDMANLGFTAPSMYNQMYNWGWQPYQNASQIAGNPAILASSNASRENYGFAFGEEE